MTHREKRDLVTISLLAVEELLRLYEADGDVAGAETALVARASLRNLERREQEAHERRYTPPSSTGR